MERTWMPTVAGVLSIISGCSGLFGFLILGTLSTVFFSSPPDPEFHEFPLVLVPVAFAVVALACLLLGGVAIYGGVTCLNRRSWGWSVAGSITSALLCTPLGLAAIILVVLSEKEIKGRAGAQ